MKKGLNALAQVLKSSLLLQFCICLLLTGSLLSDPPQRHFEDAMSHSTMDLVELLKS